MGVDIMIRRGLRAFMVVALGVGLCAVRSTLAAGADSPYVYITNIAVRTPGDGATATYRLCVMTSDPPTSLYGGVTIQDPAPSTSQRAASISYTGLGCGSNLYLFQARFTKLTAGHYTFVSAILGALDGAITSADPGTAFQTNGTGSTVGNGCQVNFDPSQAQPFANCTAVGMHGDLTDNAPPPTATSTPMPSATMTPVPPTATGASGATTAPTRTPQATVTSAPPSTPTGTALPTNTPTAIIVGGGPTATPTATSPGAPTPRPVGVLPQTRTLRPALRVTVLQPLVRPGATQHIAVSYVAHALVQAGVAFPGVRPFALHGRTDSHGHLVLTVTVPRTIKLSHGRATALVTMSAVSDKGRAQVTRVLSISDMVLSVARGHIVNCMQTATVHVAYHPNTPLRVVLLFPHGRQLTLSTRTDQHGNAMVRARVTYVHANSPVRIGVQASDAAAGARRMESTAFSVALPTACQKAATAIVTIED
jgi:hypothetical protein